MVVVSCAGKFHAFNLAEQLAKRGKLTRFYTRYAYQRNSQMRRLVSRIDREQIPPERIRTLLPSAVAAKLRLLNDSVNNNLFDRWVAMQLPSIENSYHTFVGWSGMSLRSIQQAKAADKLTIVERGSSHILYQDHILREEHKRFGKSFRIDARVIETELREYDEAHFIAIPSSFVRQTFIDQGVKADKLLVNPYGVSTYFRPQYQPQVGQKRFIVLYVGSLTVRKGLLYLFQALQQLAIPDHAFEVWFIGPVDSELTETIRHYRRANWTFWGAVNHYELATYLSQASVGIQPSVEEGLSMVIPQMLACGIPVIATTNTGAADLINPGENGYVVPIRDATQIAEHITYLYRHPEKLAQMQQRAAAGTADLTWDAYGRRYTDTIQQLSVIYSL